MLWLFFNFYKPLTVLERHKAQDAAMYPYLKKPKKKKTFKTPNKQIHH